MDWFNQNELRRYPLREDSAAVPESGEFPPDGLICDLAAVIPADYSLCLRQFSITGLMVSVSFADATTGAGLLVGTWARPLTPYQAYTLTPLVAGTSGFIVFGLDIVDRTTCSGLFPVTDPLLIDQRAVLTAESGKVEEVSVLGPSSTSLSGLVKLVAGDNIILSADGQTINVGLKAAVRQELVGPCDRHGAFDVCGAPPVRTINGVPADSEGKIIIEVQ